MTIGVGTSKRKPSKRKTHAAWHAHRTATPIIDPGTGLVIRKRLRYQSILPVSIPAQSTLSLLRQPPARTAQQCPCYLLLGLPVMWPRIRSRWTRSICSLVWRSGKLAHCRLSVDSKLRGQLSRALLLHSTGKRWPRSTASVSCSSRKQLPQLMRTRLRRSCCPHWRPLLSRMRLPAMRAG